MIKYVLTFSFIILTSISLFADQINGYFITQKGVTTNVIFKIPRDILTQEPNIQKLQWGIKYFDSNNKKQTLKPGQAKEIHFTCNGEEIRMISLYNTREFGSTFIGNNFIFLKIIIDGKMKLYNYYYTQSSPGMYIVNTGFISIGNSYTEESIILQKNDSYLYQPKWLSFKKGMADYFSDCPDLAKKIENKTYRKEDIELIVNEYNRECK